MSKSTVRVIQFTLEGPKWINWMSWQISDVPCNWSVWYYDLGRGMLAQVTDKFGDPLSGAVSPTIQRSLHNSRAIKLALGKFTDYKYDITTVETNLLEFHYDRNVNYRNYPSPYQRRARSYAIAVRNVDFGTKVTDPGTLPIEDETIVRRSPLGHVERLGIDHWSAAKAIDGTPHTYWKSEPQPVGDAVVPFYLDIRDADGGSQLIDRLDLDPVYTGPTMNIYYSNDDTVPGAFAVNRKRVEMTLEGDAERVPDTGISSLNTGDYAWVRMGSWPWGGEAVDLDTGIDYSFGFTWIPVEESSASIGSDRGLFTLEWAAGDPGAVPPLLVYFRESDSKIVVWWSAWELVTIPVTFDALDEVKVVVAVRPDTRTTVTTAVYVDVGGTRYSAEDSTDYIWGGAASGADLRVQFMMLGSASPAMSGDPCGRGYFCDVWIRQDDATPEVREAYFANTRGFMLRTGPFTRTRVDWNAVLVGRLLDNATVNIGRGDAAFELKEWVPVYRDFTLYKGIVDIPPVRAKYLKLEFTRLVARPYPLWDEGIQREYRDYPQWVHAWYAQIEERSKEVTTYWVGDRQTDASGRPI